MGQIIWGAFIAFAGTIVGRVLFAIGVQVVTLVGLIQAFDWIELEVKTQLAGLPPEVLVWIAALKIDVALSIIFSAYAFRYTYQYLGKDSVRRFVAVPPN